MKILSNRKRHKKKIGRNDPCPCGSGRKYKKCHGLSLKDNLVHSPITPGDFKAKIEELKALQKQREHQQGLGRPIISIEFKGYRFVAVGKKVYYSNKWKTFHDFLSYYIKDVFGADWGNSELKKDFNSRHQIIQWYDYVCKYQHKTILEPGKIHSAPMTGAVEAYLALAYNLYLLSHNITVQQELIKRLKHQDQFYGAYYETYVAAAFIKAGFYLEFENEMDTSTKHCEFTATSKKTGYKYSVEAKARLPYKASPRIGRKLYGALQKKANHKRVIFIDANVLDNAYESQSITWMRKALSNIRQKEASILVDGKPAPEAYVFVTNHPYLYNLETTTFSRSILAEGFKIQEFKMDTGFPSIRDALRAREKHYDMFQLFESIKEHYEIPSTFGGEIPELAFGEVIPRLQIGHRYLIPDNEGKEVIGELTHAVVDEKQGLAYGVYKLANGRSNILSMVLTDAELAAYRKYPETFFGVYMPVSKQISNPLELFDWLFEIYGKTSKEKLLEFLKSRPDYEKLKQESQEELAITYCEAMVYSMLKN